MAVVYGYVLGAVLSPTRLLVDIIKRPGGAHGASVLLRTNKVWFWAELCLCLCLSAFTLAVPNAPLPTGLGYLLVWFSVSRCNEIFFAFYRDANRHLDEAPSTTTLTSGQRIQMAMRSYIGLTVNFAIIYYFVPCKCFLPCALYNRPFNNFVEALYFSGVTIATLGYGDIIPIHPVSQLLSIYEVFSGILLVVVALAVYLANPGKTKN
jgi:hypothetical protein